MISDPTFFGPAIPILVVLIVIGLPVLCGTLIAVIAIMKSGRSKKNRKLEADETRLIQELSRNLNQLEARIESIETILLERRHHHQHHHQQPQPQQHEKIL